MKRIIIRSMACCAIFLLAACASKKAVVTDRQSPQTVTNKSSSTALPDSIQKRLFVRQIEDNRVYAQNIVGDMTLQIKRGDKSITAPGALRMRRDKVIRIQVFIPLLGTEVGRIEFTPEGVLLIDRLHKEYMQADYRQLDFLRNNGLTFYSLQALFWNELTILGKQNVTEADFKLFDVHLDVPGEQVPVMLKNDRMSYRWSVDRVSGRIEAVVVSYASAVHGQTTVNWTYEKFKPVGVKSFPAKQEFSFTTTATRSPQQGQITIDMDEVKTDSNWDERTSVSSKYKKVEAHEILGKLLNM